MNEKLAILVGGGPAPGINSVIGAATIRACLSGVEVARHPGWLQVAHRGRHLARHRRSPSRTRAASTSAAARTLGISRANPTKSPELLAKCLDTLDRLGVGMLVTIGGDDTCFSSSQLAKASKGKLRVVHVPKTIDNDLDLPQDVYTFGFQTARHIGVEIVKNLMVDAKTTSRWYFVVAMGRKAGHLALGIGKAAGATLSLVSEEFEHPGRRSRRSSTRSPAPSSSASRRAAPTASPSSPRASSSTSARATSRASRASSATRTATSASPRSTSATW